MSDDQINYDQLMQDAHRELIHKVLEQVMKTGLPGEHHFFIIFNTTHPGVRISDRLREQYPQEMTIVLQHQYSNLKVDDDRFEIQLSFNRIPELLVIPYSAISGFVDPSVPFGLQLVGDPTAGLENSIGMLVPGLPQSAIDDIADYDETTENVERLDRSELELDDISSPWNGEKTSAPDLLSPQAELREVSVDEPEEEDDDDSDAPTADIVQLDAFRKKSK